MDANLHYCTGSGDFANFLFFDAKFLAGNNNCILDLDRAVFRLPQYSGLIAGSKVIDEKHL